MKKFVLSCFVIVMVLTSCASMKKTTKEVNYPTGLGAILHNSNMVYYQGDFWILGIPETKDILGKVIEKKTIKIDNKEYEYYEIYGESLFDSQLAEEDIIKEDAFYSRQEEINTDTDTGLVLMAFLTASTKTINKVKDIKLIENAFYFRPEGHKVKEQYKNSDLFYVSKYYMGALSYFGTSELNITASVKGGFGSIDETITSTSSLNELKKGIVAIRLSSVKSLRNKSISENNYDDLIESGYKEVK
jgi:hypothetical protein